MIVDFNSSDCATGPRLATHSGQGMENGDMKAGVAISRRSRTYTAIRCAISAQSAVAPVIDWRLCVWDYFTQQLRVSTDNEAAALNAVVLPANDTAELELDLLEPIRLALDEVVLLGHAITGDSGIQNVGLWSHTGKKSISARPPQISFRAVGYAGGLPGPIGPGGAGNWPFLELA